VPMPEDPYGIAKLAVEQDLRACHEMFGLPYVIFRPHNVYGERQNIGDRYRNVIGIFMNQIMQGQPMSIFGDGTQTAERWFNTAAFAAPAAFTFGTAGRNSVYGPGLQTLDFAVVRNFAVTERLKFQFRGEFFNALNHTNLGTPDRFVNTPQFGTITEATTPGREIQLSARLSF